MGRLKYWVHINQSEHTRYINFALDIFLITFSTKKGALPGKEQGKDETEYSNFRRSRFKERSVYEE